MTIYRERLLPSAWIFLLPTLLFPSIYAVMLPLARDLALVTASALTSGFCLFIYFSSPLVVITDKELFARGASIEIGCLGDVSIIDATEKFNELGTRLDARAWVSIQASIPKLVKIAVRDQRDPTPYWLLSSRHPEKIAEILKRS